MTQVMCMYIHKYARVVHNPTLCILCMKIDIDIDICLYMWTEIPVNSGIAKKSTYNKTYKWITCLY